MASGFLGLRDLAEPLDPKPYLILRDLGFRVSGLHGGWFDFYVCSRGGLDTLTPIKRVLQVSYDCSRILSIILVLWAIVVSHPRP